MGRTKAVGQRRVTANVSLDADLLGRLDAAAQREGLTRSALLGRILRAALAYEDETSGPRTSPQDRDPRERIPWDEVKGRFGQ